MTPLIKLTRRPDITFYANGKILISARVARLLQLKTGDSINIAHFNNEFLLYATTNIIGRHEACVYPTKSHSHNFCANSVKLVRALFQNINLYSNKASFLIGQKTIINNRTYCPIITKNPLC